MTKLPELPCEECTSLDLTCCFNPQILFTMVELDEVITHWPDLMKDKAIFQGEIPGTMYVLNRPPEGVDTIKLDYCSFYDPETGRCKIYDQRPSVCSTYGDPKYNDCPYKDYTEPGELTKLKKEDPELAESLHMTSTSYPEAYAKDFIEPFVEAFKISDPEYMKFWEKLPRPNFIRNIGGIS